MHHENKSCMFQSRQESCIVCSVTITNKPSDGMIIIYCPLQNFTVLKTVPFAKTPPFGPSGNTGAQEEIWTNKLLPRLPALA